MWRAETLVWARSRGRGQEAAGRSWLQVGRLASCRGRMICVGLLTGAVVWLVCALVVTHGDGLPTAESVRRGFSSSQLQLRCVNASFSGSSAPRCHPKACMVVWMEQFPLQWMKSSGYDYTNDPLNKQNRSLTAPLYSPFDVIQCDVTKSSSLDARPRHGAINSVKNLLKNGFNSLRAHQSREIVCSCTLKADSSERMYSYASRHHLVAFGDSTLRNFVSFYREILLDAAMFLPTALLYPTTFKRKGIDEKRIPANHYRVYADRTIRGGPLQSFVEDMAVEMQTKDYTLDGKMYVSAQSPVCPLGARRIPFVSWIKESYQNLGDPSVHYKDRARGICTFSHPDNIILFTLTAGLHYLPVINMRANTQIPITIQTTVVNLQYYFDIAQRFSFSLSIFNLPI